VVRRPDALERDQPIGTGMPGRLMNCLSTGAIHPGFPIHSTEQVIMDKASSATFSGNTVHQIEDEGPLTTLPGDIYPQIFERVPVSSFFSLICTSKQAYCWVESRLGCVADTKLDTFSPATLKKSVKQRAPLLRHGTYHISEGAWEKLCRAAANNAINGDILEMLLFSFAAEDDVLEKLPLFPKLAGFLRLYLPQRLMNKNNDIEKMDTDRIAEICILSVKAMIKAERLRCDLAGKIRQLSDRRGWKIATRIFSEFNVPRQKELLLQLKPDKSASANIHHAFEKLVVVHLAAMKSFPSFLFWPNPSLPGEIKSYSDMLADVYSLPSPQSETSYLMALCKNEGLRLSANVSRSMLLPEPCKLLFRLLASEIRKNQTPGPTGRANDLQSCVVKSFITPKELEHFSRRINSRMDQGVRLEIAVDEWMNEIPELEKCVIS
jgi:hypothetical protein